MSQPQTSAYHAPVFAPGQPAHVKKDFVYAGVALKAGERFKLEADEPQLRGLWAAGLIEYRAATEFATTGREREYVANHADAAVPLFEQIDPSSTRKQP